MIAEVFHEWVAPIARFHCPDPADDLDLFMRYMRNLDKRWASAWLVYACGD